MWARYAELVCTLWLALSPSIVGGTVVESTRWVHDIACAALIAAAALLSHVERFRRAHLLSLAVSAWLAGRGWIAAWNASEPLPVAENWVAVGLLVMIFAVVPSEAARPPVGWRGEPEIRPNPE